MASLKVGLQMDPLEAVSFDGDSTFRLGLEAQERGHDIYEFQPSSVSFDEGEVTAQVRRVRLSRDRERHFEVVSEQRIALRELDVIWLRQDPPFDMSYITNTLLLDMVSRDSFVVNNPFWVRNSPEKLLVLDFPDLTPPTLITRDLDLLREFRERHGEIIVKPLYGNGGAGVFHLRKDDPNLSSLTEQFFAINREPIIAQRYLPAVTEGDKRIILVDGEPVGAINRVPAKGESRSNMHVGGRAEPTRLTAKEVEICKAIGPVLKERDLLFVGIDVIDGWLTEINVTSPTGLQEIERFDGTNISEMIWDAIEARVSQRG